MAKRANYRFWKEPKQETLPEQCNSCEFLFAGSGSGPKNRFVKTSNKGDKGLTIFVGVTKNSFITCHTLHGFHEKELMNQRAPSNVMNELEGIKREYIKCFIKLEYK